MKSASSPSVSSSYSYSSSITSHFRHQNQASFDEEELSDIGDVGERWEWNSWTENWNEVVKPLVLKDVGLGQND